mmetsp:Transcript_30593/g.40695  ORF Transcript_30593/g.40695 Transcript_30593/m.40695 type:complete len:165 (-) Transcript_30593:3224-3718(-)
MPDEDEPAEFHSIVIFIDDFSHMRPNDKDGDADENEDGPKIVQLYSETDDEKEDSPDGENDGEAKAEEEEIRPEVYACSNSGCPIPGFENDIENSCCVVCEAPRPPMEELVAAIKAKMKADKAAEKAAAAMEAGDEDDADDGEEPLHHMRLKMLKRDIRHVISH